MFKNINKSFIFFLSLFCLYLLPFSPVLAQETKEWQDINGGRCVSSTDPDVPTIQGLECLFYNVLQVIVTLAGLVFLFMFISNGFKYLFSSSDQKKLAEINSSITMTVIGLIGIIISWLILLFIKQLTGVDVITIFKIPGP